MKIEADQRQENLPTVDKVAVIILYKTEVASHWDIIFVERTEDGILQTFSNIYIYYIAYIPFVYSLIFSFSDYKYH